jgi:hypothetical protein
METGRKWKDDNKLEKDINALGNGEFVKYRKLGE